jgi:ribulose-5-phosphate 4-epimerase/fuculose-1-phosphate aldolase
MSLVQDAIQALVTANRILDCQGIVDAFGHVSVRHPEDPSLYLLSRSLSPGSVAADDIQQYTLDSVPIEPGPAPYLERFIHGGIYKARPDVNAVLHCHAAPLVAFGLTGVKLRPAIHTSAVMGDEALVWDIRDKFGDTNLLVTCNDQADDLAATLSSSAMVLMRGHGATITGPDIPSVVLTTIYAVVNANIVLQASGLGPVTFLSPGEVEQAKSAVLGPNPKKRAWDHFARLAEAEAAARGLPIK